MTSQPMALETPMGGRRVRLAASHPGVALFAALWATGVLAPLSGLIAVSVLGVTGLSFHPALTLRAYSDVLGGFRLDVVLRTLRFSAAITAIELLVAFPFALWLAKGVRRHGVKVATLVLLVIPFFLSPAARTIVWRSILGREGLINLALTGLGVTDQPLNWLLFSEFAIAVGSIGAYFPSMVWPLYISLSLVDDELIEASRDLGAGPLATFRFVILPLALPGVAAGIIFTLVPLVGDNVISPLLGGGQVLMIGEAVNGLIGVLNYAEAAAVSTLVLLVIFILQWFFWLALRAMGSSDLFAGLRR
jgi:ABC-type spermidine/putrescine transport system permease subunit I